MSFGRRLVYAFRCFFALIFKVLPYYQHFCDEVERLYEELKQLPDPNIPAPKLPTMKPTTHTTAPNPIVGSGPAQMPRTTPTVKPSS